MIDTPVLLIGLGGTGGRIAHEVWKRASPEAREFIGLHIFDTDRNPGSGLGRPEFQPLWDQGMITQTSAAMSVRDCYLSHLKTTQVGNWFPMGDVVGQKPMADGAGQVRAISRLAFLDCMARGGMRNLELTINKLLESKPVRGVAPLRVTIVNTLAGGTGSGIFLQVAMYLRYYLESRGVTNVMFRNASLLPDVFVNTKVLGASDVEGEKVRGNAYAAIKELEALNVARSSLPEADKGFVFPMEMEFRPGSAQSASVGSGFSAYETMFLFDHANGFGKNLKTADNYIEQVIDTLHLQLLSPMQGRINGQLDNLVMAILKTNGRARYGSMGSATLTYPYKGVLRYLSLKWANHGLSAQWLKIDRMFKREVEQVKKKQERDRSLVVPVLRQRYPAIIDAIGGGETPDAFFARIRRSTQIFERNAVGVEVGKDKVQLWLNAVSARITSEMERVGVLTIARGLDSVALRRESTFVEEVVAGLSSIEALHRAATASIEAAAGSVVNDVLWQDADEEPYALMNQEQRIKAGHRLNTWMLMPGEEKLDSVEGLHPVAVRYFLCRALMLVNARFRASETEKKSLRENLESLRNRYDDPKTPVKETAHDKALALRGELKWWDKKSKLDAFASMYERDVKQTSNLIAEWASKSIEHEVLRRLKAVLESMVTDWERFFNDLESTLLPWLSSEIEKALRAHESANPTSLFALASAADKERFWAHVSRDFADEGISPEVSARLYQAHYLKSVARRDDPDWESRQLGHAADEARAMFEQHILGWCSGELEKKAELQLDVLDAIRKEWEVNPELSRQYKDADAWLAKRIQDVKTVGAPWLPEIRTEMVTDLMLWGVHPSAQGVSPALFQQLFDQKVEVDGAFSRYELKYLCAVLAVQVSDIPAFQAQTGGYWRAYQTFRAEALKTPGMTSHCDKRWDSPAFLREIDNREQTNALRKLDLATLYAVFLDEVDLWSKDGKYRWRYFVDGQQRDLKMFSGMPCESDLIGLYEGLAANYRLVPEICGKAIGAESEARKQAKRTFTKLPFIQGGHALLLRCLEDAQQGGRMDGRSQEILLGLVNAFADEVLACALRFYGKDNPNKSIEAASQALSSMLEAVPEAGLSEEAMHLRQAFATRPKYWQARLKNLATSPEAGVDAETLVFFNDGA